MSWIPNETIDFSFSVGSVWLLSVNCSLECRYDDGTNSICKPKDTDSCIAACDAVKEMVRTTKKGGTIFIDHFDMSYPRESWQECLADMSESIDFVTIQLVKATLPPLVALTMWLHTHSVNHFTR